MRKVALLAFVAVGLALIPAGSQSRVTCDAAYPDVCIPSPPPDLNCEDIEHRNFGVLPPDPHKFDRDRTVSGARANEIERDRAPQIVQDKPTDNPFIEEFNATLRRECLSQQSCQLCNCTYCPQSRSYSDKATWKDIGHEDQTLEG